MKKIDMVFTKEMQKKTKELQKALEQGKRTVSDSMFKEMIQTIIRASAGQT
jgi:hypothetical protein